MPEILRELADRAYDGDPLDQIELAERFIKGSAVPRDLAQARYWLRQAASSPIPHGRYLLGVLLIQDPATRAEGVRYLRLAGELGHRPAWRALEQIYQGRLPGIPADPAEATRFARMLSSEAPRP